MKLTGNLKKEVDTIPTREGKRDAIKKAGMLLTEDELDMVSGGTDVNEIIISCNCGWSGCVGELEKKVLCPSCGAILVGKVKITL